MINSILSSHNESIIAQLRNSKYSEFRAGIPKTCEKFKKAVLPLKKFQLALEKNVTSMAYVYPLFLKTVYELNKNIKDNDQTVKSMSESLKNH